MISRHEQLTASQLKFSEKVAEGLDGSEAYKISHPDYKGHNAKELAKHVNKLPKVRAYIDQLQQMLRAKFVELAPEALDRIEEMAKSATQEKVKLQANLEILDRAGLAAPTKVEIAAIGIFGEAKPEDIAAIIRQNMAASS